MPEPVPGTPNDETRSLRPGQAEESYADGLEVQAWDVPESLGPYRLGRELGRGGMAAVYLARHRDDGREVALKVLVAADDPAGHDLVSRFEREGAAAQRLGDHPNIVSVYEVGRDGRYCWMAMAAITGAGLDELARAGDLSFDQAAHIIERVALAVEHAHAGGVLHRDIKPANILVRPNGTPLLADFGLARAYGGSELTRLTASGTVLGTPAYMPPEQAQGETLDARSDVYSLGATLFELVAGRPPFTSGRLLALLQKVVSEPPPFPRALNPAVPPRLEWIILKCLEKDPVRRYATAAALATDLERFRTGQAVEAGRGNLGRRLRGLWQRRPLLVGGGVAAAVTALAAAGLWGWSTGSQRGTRAAIAQAHAQAESITRVRQISEAYFACASRTQSSLNLLEDGYFGAPLRPEEIETALADALGVVAEVRAQYPESGVPAAWAGLLRFYSGDAGGGEAAVEKAAGDFPDDPFPHLLLGRICVARYIRSMRSGTLVYGVGRVTVEPPEEREPERALRDRAAAAFALGLDASRWHGVERGGEVRAFAEAAALFAARSNAEAAAALQALTDDPQLGRSATVLAAAASLFDKQWSTAAALFGRLAARGWGFAQALAGHALLAEGLERHGRGEDPSAQFEQAIAFATALVDRGRDPADALADRAGARQALAVWKVQRGEDARPLMMQGLRDLDRALLLADAPTLRMHRAQLRVELARAERQFGGDPGPLLARALDDAESAVRARPDVAEWRVARAETLFQMGQELERAGRDGAAVYRRAVDDLEAVKATVHDPAGVFHTLGNLYRALALREARNDGDPFPMLDRAIEAYGEVMRLLPDDGRPASGRGAAWGIRAELELRRNRDPEQSFLNALADFAEAVRRSPTLASALQNRAACWAAKAAADWKLGRDPRPAYEASVEAFRAALELTPGHPRYLEGRSKSWWGLARFAQAQGGDHRTPAEAALADLTEAIARDPRSAALRLQRGRTWREYAAWAGADADRRDQRLRAAAADFEAVERLRRASGQGK